MALADSGVRDPHELQGVGEFFARTLALTARPRAYGTLSGQDCWARWSFIGDIALTLSVNLKIGGFT